MVTPRRHRSSNTMNAATLGALPPSMTTSPHSGLYSTSCSPSNKDQLLIKKCYIVEDPNSSPNKNKSTHKPTTHKKTKKSKVNTNTSTYTSKKHTNDVGYTLSEDDLRDSARARARMIAKLYCCTSVNRGKHMPRRKKLYRTNNFVSHAAIAEMVKSALASGDDSNDLTATFLSMSPPSSPEKKKQRGEKKDEGNPKGS